MANEQWTAARATFGTEPNIGQFDRQHHHRWQFVKAYYAPSGGSFSTAPPIDVQWSLSHCEGCGQALKQRVIEG